VTLSRRLGRIEHKIAQSARSGPLVIVVCSAETGEPNFALIIGGGTIRRDTGEAPEDFYVRADGVLQMGMQMSVPARFSRAKSA
jgi:hypothetical protein